MVAVNPIRRATGVVALGLLFGCGETTLSPGAVTHELRQPIVTLRASVVQRQGRLDEQNLRAAVSWTSLADLRQIATDIAVSPAGFGGFTVAIDELPPEIAMGGVAGDRTAFGTLVLYQDRNGNGVLDQVPFEARAAPDRVLGDSAPGSDHELYFISFFESANEEHGKGFFVEKWSILADDVRTEYLPIDTPIPVVVTGNPDDFASYMCTNNPLSPRIFNTPRPTTLADALPEAVTPNSVVCEDSGLRVSWGICDNTVTACSPGTFCVERADRTISLSMFDERPADWPCATEL